MLLTSLNPAAVAGHDLPDAVRFGDVTLSRSDLVGAATSVAERVGGADRVAVLATPTVSTVLAITGCLIAGVPVVPVPSDVGQAERRHMLTDSGAKAWLGPVPDQPGGLPHIPVRMHARSWHRFPEPSPQATAMIIYTSGTTGPPKGVEVSGQAIAADLDALARRGSGQPRTCWCTDCRCSICTGWCWACSGRCGSETASCTPENQHRRHTRRRGGTLYFGVPTVWSRVVGDTAAAEALRPARLLVSGSAGLPVPVFDQLVRLTGQHPSSGTAPPSR